MDLNIRIIECIKQFPSLYNGSGSLDERNHTWAQLADKLKMNEQFLKIRWHSLLQGYQREENFKYAKRMHYIERNLERKNKDNWPEFIITEEYLKDKSPEEEEQFVYLDADEEADNSKTQHLDNPKTQQSVECHFQKRSKDETISEKEEIKEVDLSKKPYKTVSEDVKVNSLHESDEHKFSNDTTSNVEREMAEVDMNKNNEVSIMATSEVVSFEKSQSFSADRCEDTIFGELVSAMLKRMDENKKKNIKREIMNLLFA